MDIKQAVEDTKSMAQNGLAKTKELGQSAIAKARELSQGAKPIVASAAKSVASGARDAATILEGFARRLARSDRKTMYEE